MVWHLIDGNPAGFIIETQSAPYDVHPDLQFIEDVPGTFTIGDYWDGAQFILRQDELSLADFKEEKRQEILRAYNSFLNQSFDIDGVDLNLTDNVADAIAAINLSKQFAQNIDDITLVQSDATTITITHADFLRVVAAFFEKKKDVISQRDALFQAVENAVDGAAVAAIVVSFNDNPIIFVPLMTNTLTGVDGSGYPKTINHGGRMFSHVKLNSAGVSQLKPTISLSANTEAPIEYAEQKLNFSTARTSAWPASAPAHGDGDFISINAGQNTFLETLSQRFNIMSITHMGSIATVTTNIPHNFNVGEEVCISGANETEYNTPFTISVSSVTRSGQEVTVVTSDPHNFISGQLVKIAGANETAYNGGFIIKRVNSTTFTFLTNDAPTTPATGTISATSYAIVTRVTSATSFEYLINGSPSTPATTSTTLYAATTAPIGCINTWRFQFSWVGKANGAESGVQVIFRNPNPLSSFVDTSLIFLPDEALYTSGEFTVFKKTIADEVSLPAPWGSGAGYELSIIADDPFTVTLESLLRTSEQGID